MARYLPNGDLDPGFGGGDGKVTSDLDVADRDTDLGNAIALQPDGGIVVAGERRLGGGFALVRNDSAGDFDASFGIVISPFAGSINGVALRLDGRIVAGGDSFSGATDSNFAVARYESDGDLDPNFGLVTTDVSGGRQFGHDFGEDLAIQPDGKIVAVGHTRSGFTDEFALVRINP